MRRRTPPIVRILAVAAAIAVPSVAVAAQHTSHPSNVTHRPRLATDFPRLYIGDTVDDFSLDGTTLYWDTTCTPGGTVPRSHIRTAPGEDAGTPVTRTLYNPALCRADHVASQNVVVGGPGPSAYWISHDGQILRQPVSASFTRRPTHVGSVSGVDTNGCCWLTIANGYLYWTRASRLYRMPLAGGPEESIFRGHSELTHLLHDGQGSLLFLDGEQLTRLRRIHAGPRYFWQSHVIQGPVSAFTYFHGEVYYGVDARGASYYIVSQDPESDTPRQRRIFTSHLARIPGGRYPTIDAIAADGPYVFWHPIVNGSTGPIMRWSRTDGSVLPLTLNIRIDGQLAADGQSVFWSRRYSGIFRLPGNASVVPPSFTVTDISPNLPYGQREPARGGDMGADPAGRFEEVLADPTDPSTVYAVGQHSGVWKSTDAGASWQWSSAGLDTETLAGTSHSLSIDAGRPRRLVFITANQDFRSGSPTSGIHVSFNGGRSWQHVDPSGCTPQPITAQETAFSHGSAFVSSRCGILSSSDLLSWTKLPATPAFTGVAAGFDLSDAHLASTASTLFACNGSDVFTYDVASASWTSHTKLNGTCEAIDGISSYLLPTAAVVIGTYDSKTPPNLIDEHAAIVSDGSVTPISPPVPQPSEAPPFCCGAITVWTPARPDHPTGSTGAGRSFDLYVGQLGEFYELDPSQKSWHEIPNIHTDTWSMTFPRTYNPEKGVCTAYASNDGGVFKDIRPVGNGSCQVWDGPWRDAASGLRGFRSTMMAGISRPACGHPVRACPVLFLPGPDDDTWNSRDGGAGWQLMGCCGDSGREYTDPSAPWLVATARNATLETYVSPGNGPPTPSDDRGNFLPEDCDTAVPHDCAYDGGSPPPERAISQILTDNEAPPRYGDFVTDIPTCAPQTTPPGPGCPGDDSQRLVSLKIVRSTRVGDTKSWFQIGPLVHQAIGGIDTSGGHRRPTIYLRTQDNNQILVGHVNASGDVPAWSPVWSSSTPNHPDHAYTMYADPYDPSVLYVVDDSSIKSTDDGGRTWKTESGLTEMVTHHGLYDYGCEGGGLTSEDCPLMQMIFIHDQPQLRIAILFPSGVAFSNDSGNHWFPVLDGAEADPKLLDRTSSAFYDLNGLPGSNNPSLYLALNGRGLVRIDGPFSELEGGFR